MQDIVAKKKGTYNKDVASVLQKLMNDRNLTLEIFAEELGISPRTLQRILACNSVLSYEQIDFIEEKYQINFSTLIGKSKKNRRFDYILKDIGALEVEAREEFTAEFMEEYVLPKFRSKADKHE